MGAYRIECVVANRNGSVARNCKGAQGLERIDEHYCPSGLGRSSEGRRHCSRECHLLVNGRSVRR